MSLRRRRRWEESDEDPAAGLLNLFDVWLAFAAALLLAVGGGGAARLAEDRQRVDERRVKVERFRPTSARASGDGRRLGTAYRLESGEVVYVPDEPPRGAGP